MPPRSLLALVCLTVLLALPVAAVDASSSADPPPNDNFADAVVIDSLPMTLVGSNVGATVEPNERMAWCYDMGATVWYRFTPEVDANVMFENASNDFDDIINAYRGTSPSNLELLDCGYGSSDSGAKVSFAVVAGETYYLQAAGGAGGEVPDTGSFEMSGATAGAISGTVVGEEGQLAQACIRVYEVDGNQVGFDGVENGTEPYWVGGLAPGEYHLEFTDCSYPSRHLPEWHADARDRDSADPVVVVGDETVTGVDAVLDLAGVITGRITDAVGESIPGSCISVYDEEGEYVDGTYTYTGEYMIGGLSTGGYRVRFEDCGNPPRFAPEWYDDGAHRLEATLLPVVEGEDARADAMLTEGGSISGRLTKQSGEAAYACIGAFDAAGDAAGYDYAKPNGTYEIPALYEGVYSVKFSPCGPHLAQEWYDDKIDRATSDPVSVVNGAVTPGIDAVLSPQGFIGGKVRDAAGMPIRDICVDAYSPSGESVSVDWTNKNGGYQIGWLRAGEYRVGFSDCSWEERSGGRFRPSFYDGAADLALAQTVSVEAKRLTPRIDATLLRPGVLLIESDAATEVEEGGGGDAYSVMLGAPPTADVAVTLSTDGQTAVAPSSLTFTAGNWNAAQQVVVEAVDDTVAEGAGNAVVTHALASADPAFDQLRSDLSVAVADNDVIPGAVSLVYDGDVSVLRGQRATFSATLIDAATGEPLVDRKVRIEVGDMAFNRRTNDAGHVSVERVVELDYGPHWLSLSYAGEEWFLPAHTLVDFRVGWEYTFVDGARAVTVNPTTDELQFVAPGDTSEIKQGIVVDPTTLATGHRLIRFAYADNDLRVDLEYQVETGQFAALVKTAATAYVLRGAV